MIADLLQKFEEDGRERQAHFQNLPPAVQDGINRRVLIGQYVGPLAPVVDQFSSADRAKATGAAALKLGGSLAHGAKHALLRLGKKPKPGQPQFAEQVGHGILAAPEVLRGLRDNAPAIGAGLLQAIPSFAAELTGVPAFMRAEAAAQRADAAPIGQRGRGGLAAIGETAGGALTVVPGLGLAGKAAKLGTSAKLAKVVEKSTLPLAATSALAVLGSPDAIAQEQKEPTDQILDDLLRDSKGRSALRVGDVDVGNIGFYQGLSLNNLDDQRRQGPQVKSRLDELRRAVIANPQDTVAQLDLLRAEREYDPISFAQRLDPNKFHHSRVQGEVSAGALAALGSIPITALAPKSLKPFVNAGLGAVKGAAYGYGAGVGDVDQNSRLTRAGIDAGISAGISHLSVPAAKQLGRTAVHSPIHAQQAKNLIDRLISELYPGPLGGSPARALPVPAAKTTARIGAPKITSLKRNASAFDAYRAAILVDGQTPFAYPRQLGQGRTERALLSLARSEPGGAAALERGTQQSQLPVIKRSLKQLEVPVTSKRRVPQKGLARDLLDSAFDFSAPVSDKWVKQARNLTSEQQAALAKSILARASSQPISVLQQSHFAQRLNALGVRGTGQAELINPELLKPHQITEKPNLDALTEVVKGPPIRGLGEKADPRTAQKLAEVANASRNLGYIPESARRPVEEFFKTRREAGYAPLNKKQGAAENLAKLIVLSASVPLTDVIDDRFDPFAGLSSENVSPIQGAQPGFLPNLAYAENAQILTQSQGDLSNLQQVTQSEIGREIGKLRRRRQQLTGQMREAERKSRISSGPDGEDLSRQANLALQRARALRAELAELGDEESVRKRVEASIAQHTLELNSKINKAKTRAQTLRELSGRDD